MAAYVDIADWTLDEGIGCRVLRINAYDCDGPIVKRWTVNTAITEIELESFVSDAVRRIVIAEEERRTWMKLLEQAWDD